jgi:hypothetical protein
MDPCRASSLGFPTRPYYSTLYYPVSKASSVCSNHAATRLEQSRTEPNNSWSKISDFSLNKPDPTIPQNAIGTLALL